MGLNIDRLRSGLRDYQNHLERHVQKLNSSFNSLQSRFMALSREYDGRAAEEFRSSWSKTAAWFKDYIKQTRKLSKILDERLKYLENTNV